MGLTIKEVSEKYGIPADTLRYYEKVGVIPPVTRTSGGIRDYCESDISWVKNAKCMRAAGLSIEALIEYVALFRQGEDTAEARKNLLVEQRRSLCERIEEMQRTLDRLDQKISGYHNFLADKKLK